MNLSNYVKKLKPVTEKYELLSSLDQAVGELNNKTIPIVSTTAAALKTIEFKSKEAKILADKYRFAFKVNKNESIFSHLLQRLNEVNKNMLFIKSKIDQITTETISSLQIDARTATCMQMVESCSYIARYARKFIEYISILETDASGLYIDYKKNNITSGEIKFIENRLAFFLNALEQVSEVDYKFKKKFEEIPNVVLGNDDKAVSTLFSKNKLDPYRMNFIPVKLNPFFLIGKWYVEYQANRHKEAQEDLIRIKNRIYLLEQANKGHSDPKIEKEIELLSNKAEKLTYQINKTEEECQ